MLRSTYKKTSTGNSLTPLREDKDKTSFDYRPYLKPKTVYEKGGDKATSRPKR